MEENLICFEVETKYTSGRTRTETLSFKDEEAMWEYYNAHHNLDLIQSAAITDSWSV